MIIENKVGIWNGPIIMSISKFQFLQIQTDNKLPKITIKNEIKRNFVQLNLPFLNTINAIATIPRSIVIEPKYRFKAISSKIEVGNCSSIYNQLIFSRVKSILFSISFFLNSSRPNCPNVFDFKSSAVGSIFSIFLIIQY